MGKMCILNGVSEDNDAKSNIHIHFCFTKIDVQI